MAVPPKHTRSPPIRSSPAVRNRSRRAPSQWARAGPISQASTHRSTRPPSICPTGSRLKQASARFSPANSPPPVKGLKARASAKLAPGPARAPIFQTHNTHSPFLLVYILVYYILFLLHKVDFYVSIFLVVYFL